VGARGCDPGGDPTGNGIVDVIAPVMVAALCARQSLGTEDLMR
jgi:hypothetical protein